MCVCVCVMPVLTSLYNQFICLGIRRKVKVLAAQSCLTLCDPTDCSPPGSSVHGILQARILEWVASPFPSGSSWPTAWAWNCNNISTEIFLFFGTKKFIFSPSHFFFLVPYLGVTFLVHMPDGYFSWVVSFNLMPEDMKITPGIYALLVIVRLLNFVYSSVWVVVSHCHFV